MIWAKALEPKAIFNSYVSLQEGNHLNLRDFNQWLIGDMIDGGIPPGFHQPSILAAQRC